MINYICKKQRIMTYKECVALLNENKFKIVYNDILLWEKAILVQIADIMAIHIASIH